MEFLQSFSENSRFDDLPPFYTENSSDELLLQTSNLNMMHTLCPYGSDSLRPGLQKDLPVTMKTLCFSQISLRRILSDVQ